jgi:hypothetical protein
LDLAQHADPDAMTRDRRNVVLQLGQEISVEMQWRFTNADIGLEIELSDLEQRLGSINLSGSPVPIFSPDDLAILLAVNGARHQWSRLEWLCGYGELFRSYPGIDIGKVVAASEKLGVRRMVLLGLLLAHELLRVSVPADTISQSRSDRWVPRLSRDVQRLWAAGAGEAEAVSVPMNAFLFRLREQARDQVRFILRRAKYPTGRVVAGQQPTRTADVLLEAVWPTLAIPRRPARMPQPAKADPV